MKIILKETGETLATIITNHSMTTDEACELAGIELMKTSEDYQNGDGYDINDIELEY